MRQFFNSISARMAFFFTSMLALGASAMASESGDGSGTAISSDGFDDFEATVLDWVNGPLGVGLAITALVVGGGTGIIQANPMPAIAGLALAAFFAWGPAVVVSLVTGGALVG